MVRSPDSKRSKMPEGARKRLPDAFVTTEAPRVIGEAFENAKTESSPKKKWQSFLSIYNKISPWVEAFNVADEHAREQEGSAYKRSAEQQAFIEAIGEYKSALPRIKDEYVDHEIKFMRRRIKRMVPYEDYLEDIDLDERKRMFEGDRGLLKWFKNEIENTKRYLDSLKLTPMIDIDREAKTEIYAKYLRELERQQSQVGHLYWKYVELAR